MSPNSYEALRPCQASDNGRPFERPIDCADGLLRTPLGRRYREHERQILVQVTSDLQTAPGPMQRASRQSTGVVGPVSGNGAGLRTRSLNPEERDWSQYAVRICCQ